MTQKDRRPSPETVTTELDLDAAEPAAPPPPPRASRAPGKGAPPPPPATKRPGAAAAPPAPPAVARTSRPSVPPAAPPAAATAPARASAPPPPPPGRSAAPAKARPEAPAVPPDDARRLIERCQRALGAGRDPVASARLHFELGRLYEQALGDPVRAADHFTKAVELQPDHRPAIVAARRAYRAAGKHRQALPLFDAEARLLRDPKARAQVLSEKAAWLEHGLDQHDAALEVYREAATLAPGEPAWLDAVARLERRKGALTELDATYVRLAAAMEDDAAARATTSLERARLLEARERSPEKAVDLLEAALASSQMVSGLLPMLARLAATAKRPKTWLEALQRWHAKATDPRARAHAMAQIAEILAGPLGERDRAIDALREALHETPDDSSLWGRLAEWLESVDRPTDLVEALEKRYALLSPGPDRLTVAHRLGELHLGPLADAQKARQWLTRALEDDATHASSRRSLEALLEREGDFEALVDLYKGELEVVHETKPRAQLLERMAVVLETKLGLAAEATDCHARALQLVPTYEASFGALTRLLGTAGRFDELVAVYERAVEVAPDASTEIAWLFRVGSLCELELDDAKRAIAAYERILTREPKNLGALQALARAASRASDARKQVDALERERELTSEANRRSELAFRLAEVLDTQAHDDAKAQHYYREVLAFDAAHRGALSALGRLYERSGRFGDLKDVFEREIALEPKGSSKWLGIEQRLAELYERHLARADEAVKHYRAALAEDPLYEPALRGLSALLERRGAFAELVDLRGRHLSAIRQPRERAQEAYFLGRIVENEVGDRKRALDLYETAIGSDPGHLGARWARARVLAAEGSFERLAEVLAEDAEASPEPSLGLDAHATRAIILADRVQNVAAAAEAFEAYLSEAPEDLVALRSLDFLYAADDEDEKRIRVLSRLASAYVAPSLRLAALREVARLHGKSGSASYAEAIDAWRAVLAIQPSDLEALRTLAGIAAEVNDVGLGIMMESKLASVVDDTHLAAAHHARVGALLEANEPAAAVAAYRASLALDADGIVAIDGLGRMGAKAGDRAALREAAKHEQRLALDPERASRIFVESAKLAEAAGDVAAALDDYEAALEASSNDDAAVQGLITLARKAGETRRLVDALTRAADQADKPSRQADFRVAIAETLADDAQDLAGAIGILQKALESTPGHVGALGTLARLLERATRWEEAARTLGRIAQLSQDHAVQADAELRRARILDERLGDARAALECIRAVVAHAPKNREALGRMGRLLAKIGRHQEALDVARKLVDSAGGVVERAAALVELGAIERVCGHVEPAIAALGEALAVEGPGGIADEEYRAMLGVGATWERYSAALRTFLKNLPADDPRAPGAMRALARVIGDELRRPDDAVAILQDGIRRYPEARDLWVETARRLRALRRLDDSLALLRKYIDHDVRSVDAYREISAVHRAAGRTLEAINALMPLVILGAATKEEAAAVAAQRGAPSSGQPGLLGEAGMRELEVDGCWRVAAFEVGVALGGTLAKLYPADLRRYNVGRKGKLAPRDGHPLREIADRVSLLLGQPAFELYVHGEAIADVATELGEPPTILAPTAIESLSTVAQTYLIGRRLAAVARGVPAVDRVPEADLGRLLLAGVSHVVPGLDFARLPGIEATEREIGKALPRRDRRPLEIAGGHFAATPTQHLDRWVRSLRAACARAGLLLADNLVVVAEVLRSVDRDEIGRGGLLDDALRFWVSDTAVRYRAAR